RIPRRFRFYCSGNQRLRKLRRSENEHRYRYPMGNLGRCSELLQSERSLSAGSVGQPERRRSAEQEILRSARMAACRSDFDDRSSGKSIPGTKRDRRSVRYSFLLISRPALRVFFSPKEKMPDALRLSGLHVSCNILNLKAFVGLVRR